MITRNLINRNIKFFYGNEVKDFTYLSSKIDKYKNSLKNVKETGYPVSLAFPEITIDNLSFIFALLELKIPIINIHRHFTIFNDKNIKNSIIFSYGEMLNDIQNINFISNEYQNIFDFQSDHYNLVNVDSVEEFEDEILLVYFSSGTTGAPKKYLHTHKSVIKSAENSKEFYSECKTCFWFENQTINHFGIFTTTILPSLMYCENIILGYDLQNPSYPNVDIFTIFTHNVDILKNLVKISESFSVITGGTKLGIKVIATKLKEVFPEKDWKVFNVFGCTEICTPLMWNSISISDEILDDSKFFTFDYFIDGLEIIFDENETIMGFKPNPAFYDYGTDIVKANDILIKRGNSIEYVSRKIPSIKVDVTRSNGQAGEFGITYEIIEKFVSKLFRDDNTLLIHFENEKFFVFVENLEGFSNITINLKFLKFLSVEYDITIWASSLKDVEFRLIEVPNIKTYHNGLKLDAKKILRDYYEK